MPSSGSVTYSINETSIISLALQMNRAYGASQTIKSADVSLARDLLNMIIKQWSGNSDYAPGIKMWTRRRAYVFMQKDQSSYSLGPSGSHATASYVTTTTTANAAGGAGSIVVSSASGISSGDNIGVVLNSGSIQWTTVNGAPAGSTVTLAATLTGAAAAGARVFAYTTKVRRPLKILTAMLKGTDNLELPVDPGMTLEEYEVLSDKTVDGTPGRAYYEAQLTNGVLYVDRQPDDVTKVLSIVYLTPIEDTTAANETLDFPQEWFRPLMLQLAIDSAIPFGMPITPELKGLRDEALYIARASYPQVDRSYFEPNADGEA